MQNIYDSQILRNKIYEKWKKYKLFQPIYSHKKKYCIVIPPPNITGNLHMGHAFQCTLIDILIRFYKMKKHSVLWKAGTDHAGIATQILIENKINKKYINNKKFLFKKTMKWKNKSANNIKNQLQTLGCLLNWKTERFTLDKTFSYSVKKVFIKLYEEKLIYKSKKLVNWDIKLKTAISDLEIVHKKENNSLYYIKYFFYKNKKKYIVIATTRPETIFADQAIAINTNDDRYSKLINYSVIIPIVNRKIPIIFDKNIDMNFGTGCVKITPAHDFNDFKIGEKYKLKTYNIITKDGKLNKNVLKDYRNMEIKDARKLIVCNLKKQGFLSKIESYISNIPRGDRSNSIIEPLIMEQWYINTKELSKPVIENIKNKNIKIIPKKWEKIFFSWLNNMKDWCISRQIWWGHRMPIWYDKYKNIYVGNNKKHIKEKYKLKNNYRLKQEKSVLDTWFSSALWPFASLGWPKNTKEYKNFYPTNILITGFDIIFFWAIKMIMFGIKITGKIPFKEIYIHGLIRDNLGNKMSKTRGNVLDPLDIINGISSKNLIKKQTLETFNKNIKNTTIKQFPNGIESHGSDALRFTFCSIATNNMDIKFDIKKVKDYKNFCNKIWNAHKFVKKNILNKKIFLNLSIYDKWILSIWEKNKLQIMNCINKKNFSKMSMLLYKFSWNEFCNWYIEFSKIIIKYDINKLTTKFILTDVFKEFIKMLHPIMPYITEEMWFNIKDKKKPIISEKFPIYNKLLMDKLSEDKIKFLKILSLVIRSKKLNKYTNIMLNKINIFNLKKIEKIKSMLIYLLKIKNLYITNKMNVENIIKIDVVENIEIYIDIKNTEKKVISNKDKNKIYNEIKKIENMLKNKVFIEKAKTEIIKYKLEKLKNLKSKINKFIS